MLEGWTELLRRVGLLTTPSDTQPGDLRRGQTIQFAVVDVAAAGDSQIVAADATRKIKLLSYVIVADGTVAVRWLSNTPGGTSRSGAIALVANTGVAVGGGNAPGTHWELETAAAEPLVLNLSGAVGVRGHLAYFVET